MEDPTVEEHLHYLKVLKKSGSIFQPEIRAALNYAVGLVGTVRELVKQVEKIEG